MLSTIDMLKMLLCYFVTLLLPLFHSSTHITHPINMHIVITRQRKTFKTIDGRLTIDGHYMCDTAENAITAIPAGTYEVRVVKCHQYARKMPVLALRKNMVTPCAKCAKLACVSNNSTMPCKCAMLKPGNGVYHRKDSSIILGTYLAPGCLVHPRQAFNEVYDRIRKPAKRGHALTLTIVDNCPQPPKVELSNFEMGLQILRQM